MANKAVYDVAPGYHSECVFSHFFLANSTQVTQVSRIICCCLMACSFHTIQVSAQRLFYRRGGLHFIFPQRTYHHLTNYILSYPSVSCPKHSTPLTKCNFTRIKDGVSFITISPLPIYLT